MLRKIELTANQLKLIAIIAMLVDHVAWWLVPLNTITGQAAHAFGRLTAPIMCYFIAEGYYHTSNLKKYLGRLLLFAALSHFPYVLYFGYRWYQTTGVLWSLMMGLLALAAVKKENLPGVLKLGAILVCGLLAYQADWSYIPVLWIVAFGFFKGDFKKQMTSFALIALLCYILPGGILESLRYTYTLGALFAIPLLWLYHGKRGGGRGKWQKWFFYAFYPLHLLVLFLLRLYAYFH